MLDTVKVTLLKRALFSIERALEQPEHFKSNVPIFVKKIHEIIELNDRLGGCEKENNCLKALETKIFNVRNSVFDKDGIIKSLKEIKIE